MLNLFNNEKSADIVFGVGDDEMKSSVGLSRYHAHRLILQECAPSELCPPPDEENDITNIPITDVHPDIFHHLLITFMVGKLCKRNH